MELLDIKEDVRTLWWNRGFGISHKYANDLHVNLSHMNYFLVAGTPKWIFNNETIYRHCLEYQKPLSLVGVGTRDIVSPSQVSLMKKIATSGLCEVALARDSHALEGLREFGFKNTDMILDPCFFKSPTPCSPRQMNVVGWREQYHIDGELLWLVQHPGAVVKALTKGLFAQHKNKRHVYDQIMVSVFHELPSPKLVIVHDNREISPAENLFGANNVFYSTDHNELFKKYAQTKYYFGSRIHGAIPSLIHGANIELLYTTSKAQVISDAIKILSKHYPPIQEHIKVHNFNGSCVDPPKASMTELDIQSLQSVITKEKLRIKEILRSQPILKTYLRESTSCFPKKY